MYGFKETKCKIEGCENPVWPNKTLGFCNLHYQRYKTGRMTTTGELLPLPAKIKTCESCGMPFTLKKMERNIRFCKECRPKERRKLQNDHNCGIYRRGGKRNRKLEEKYFIFSLNKIIEGCESIKNHAAMLKMRQSGMTYKEIARQFGCSRQNIYRICSKNL